jgi:hypothetical protein
MRGGRIAGGEKKAALSARLQGHSSWEEESYSMAGVRMMADRASPVCRQIRKWV